MNRIRYVPALILLAGSILMSVPGLAADNQCVNCHQNSDYFVEYPKLYEYYQQWLGSPHEKTAVLCDDCHGGDADATSINQAHIGVLPMSDNQSALYYQNQPDTCGQCHSGVRSQFIQSKHFTELGGQRSAPTCTTCHPAMSRRPDYRLIVLNACRNCHGEGNSENLPLITDQAENLFHQLNIAGGLLGWTRIHYESLGWPESSRERLRDLDTRHHKILNWVHQFDLQESEATTLEMLGELREIFDEAQRAHKQNTGE